MYLLDTNVISELRKTRPHGAVLAWLNTVADADLFLCAVTVGEIQAGIEITREQNPAKAAELEDWLADLLRTRAVLPLDAPVMRTWARLMHKKPTQLYEDALIAAVARVHGLTVVTRNVGDFKGFGVGVVNPFTHGTAR